MPQVAPQLDHLVIAARTLTDAVDWCAETLGVVPGPGGSHPLMGTHNRLIPIGSQDYPNAYLELIAIDPSATQPSPQTTPDGSISITRTYKNDFYSTARNSFIG
jgi:hypothetical protein